MANKPTTTLTFAGDEKRLTESFDRVNRGAKQMGDQVESSSSKMANAADQGYDKAGKAADKAGKSFDGAGKSFSAGAGAILAGGAALGLAIGDAFSKSFEKADVGAMLVAQLGGGAERAGELGELAGKIYGDNFGESITDVGAALKGVLGSGLVDEDATDADIKRVTEKLLTVAQVVGEDADAVSRSISQMLKTGMAKSAEEAFDLVVRAQQQGINKSGDLLDTLNEYGTQFRKIGIDGPTALGLLSQAVRGGARDADIAADAIKEFSIRAVDGSKATADAFKELLGPKSFKNVMDGIAKGGPAASQGLDKVLDALRAVKDPAKQAQLATALFGTQAEDLGKALFAMDASTAVAAMGDIAGATDAAMVSIGDTPAAKFEAFKRNMESTLIDVIARAAPMLESFGAFVQQNIDVLGPLAAVIAVVTIAQWLWNAAVAANPIVLIILGIAALVAGIMILWNRSEGFRNYFIGMWHMIQTIVGSTVGGVVGAWDFMVNLIIGTGGRINAFFNGIGEGIRGAFRSAFNFVIDAWNNSVGRLNFDVPSWVPGIGGSHFGVPKISRMHTGGDVPGMPGEEVLTILQAGEHVDTAGQGGGGTTIVAAPGADRAVANFLNELIRKRYLNVVRT